MSKRNFVVLIIVLAIGTLIVFGILFRRSEAPEGGSGGSESTNFISRWNPFARNPSPPPGTPPPPRPTEEEPNLTGEVPQLKLTKVSSVGVAGYGVYKKERLKEVFFPIPGETPPPGSVTPAPPGTEFATAIRYVDRVSGNIYQTFADKIEERRFSTTIIPKVYEALIGGKGMNVIMRYLKVDGKTIETFVGSLPKELLGGDTMENNDVKGTFLPENITDVSLSPDSQKLFYMWNVGDGVVGTVHNFTDNKKAQVFDSPFTEWLSHWPKSSLIALNTKPSANIPGHLYVVDVDRKTTTRALGGIDGLTTLMSPDGKLVLYSSSNLALYIYHTDTKTSDLLGLNTLPEKCVWGSLSDTLYCGVPKLISGGQYPDSWYKGEVSFNDQIWKIDLGNGTTTMIEDPFLSNKEEIDAVKLALDEEESNLFFVNKKDSYLWKLDLR